MVSAVVCKGFEGSPFRRLPSELLGAVCSFLVSRDVPAAEDNDADWALRLVNLVSSSASSPSHAALSWGLIRIWRVANWKRME